MAGKAVAVANGTALEHRVATMGAELGLRVQRQVKLGRRLWGAERRIDLVFTDPTTRRTLGVECKFQRTSGTAEEKLPAVLADMDSWPMRGLLVFAGPGFSANLKHFLYSTGKAADLADLRQWLVLYFGLGGEDAI